MPSRTLLRGALAALLILLAHSALAAGQLPQRAEDVKPLTTGEQAPAFTVRTVENKPYQFDPENLERPTILISFRGGWCPYCNLHLSELRTVIPQLRDIGYDVLFLSGDRPDRLYSSLAKETQDDIAGLDYVILSDADIHAARALGTAFRTSDSLVNFFEQKGRDYEESSIDRHQALAVPAVYVINQSGRIVYDFINPDYKVRLPADEMLAAAQAALR